MSDDERTTDERLDDIEGMIGELEAPEVDPREAMEIAQEMALWNLEMYPAFAQQGANIGRAAMGQFDQVIEDRFYANIEAIAGDPVEAFIEPVQAAMDVNRELADQLLTGEVPQEVEDQILNTMAEMQIQGGVFGPSAGIDMVQMLGLSSMDLMMQGASIYASTIPQLSSQMLQHTMALQPPVVDPLQVAMTATSQILGGPINPNIAMQTAADIGIANAQMAWQADVSALNASMDIWSTQQEMAMARDVADANQQAAMWGAIGAAGGAAGTAAALIM